MSDVDPPGAAAIREVLDTLRTDQQYHRNRAAEIEVEARRYETALAALMGEPINAQGRKSQTAGLAIRAALATFDAPVSSERLMDHADLVNYSRHTLRSALSELRRSGRIAGERGPKGFIWDPRSAVGAD